MGKKQFTDTTEHQAIFTSNQSGKKGTSHLFDHKWSRRRFLGTAAVTGAGVMGLSSVLAACGGGDTTSGSGEPTPVVLGINGGDYYKSIYNAALKPFEQKYNAKIVPVFGDGNTLLNKALAEKNNPTMDAIITFQGAWLVGRAEGIFEKLDYKNIPNIENVYDFLKDPEEYGPFVNMAAWGIVYNKETVAKPPTAFKQLWEPQYKGQLMIGGTFHWDVHLAAYAHVWTGDQHNIDAAFDKVKALMPNVTEFYGLTSDAQSKFQQGVGQMATWYSNSAQRLRQLGLPLEFQVPEEGAFLYPTGYQAIKGTTKKDLVEKMIGQFYDPETCTKLAETEGYIPANQTVKLEPELQKQLLSYDQVLATHQWDWDFLNKNKSNWLTRWNAEVKPLLKS